MDDGHNVTATRSHTPAPTASRSGTVVAPSRRVITSAALPDAPGWSHGIAAGGWLFGGAMMATDYTSGLLSQARPSPDAPWFHEDLDLESSLVLDYLESLVMAAGGDMRTDLLRVWQWIKASYPDHESYARFASPWPALPNGLPYARNLARRVGDRTRASTGIGVRQLPVPDALLALDFLAVPGSGAQKHEVAMPAGLPAPKAGYAPAVRHGDWVFLSGFGATDFTGDWMSQRHMGTPSMVAPEARVNPYIWLGSEIEAQTRYTLDALGQLAEAAGSSLDRCVKADVTLTHPSDFAGMDRVWREFFPESPPARNVTTGAQLVVKGVRVEIAMVLLAGDAAAARRPIHADGVPAPVGHASQAVHAGDFLFTSTLLPVDASGTVPGDIRDAASAPWFRGAARRQAELVAGHLAMLCEAAGTSIEQVCKVQAFLSDLCHLDGMLGAWRSIFPAEPPALSAVGLGGGCPLLPGATLQWDVIGYAPAGS